MRSVDLRGPSLGCGGISALYGSSTDLGGQIVQVEFPYLQCEFPEERLLMTSESALPGLCKFRGKMLARHVLAMYGGLGKEQIAPKTPTTPTFSDSNVTYGTSNARGRLSSHD